MSHDSRVLPTSRPSDGTVFSQRVLASGERFRGHSPEVATNRQSGFVNTAPLQRTYPQELAYPTLSKANFGPTSLV